MHKSYTCSIFSDLPKAFDSEPSKTFRKATKTIWYWNYLAHPAHFGSIEESQKIQSQKASTMYSSIATQAVRSSYTAMHMRSYFMIFRFMARGHWFPVKKLMFW